MTKTEILEKIDKGLRGQGNQVDIGGVLADVLDGIVESIPEGEQTLTVKAFESGSGDYADAAEALGITENQFADLMDGKYSRIRINKTNTSQILTRIAYSFNPQGNYKVITFGGVSQQDTGAWAEFSYDDTELFWYYWEP